VAHGRFKRRQADLAAADLGMAASGAIRRRSIGTLAGGAQARYRSGAQESHRRARKRLVSRDIQPCAKGAGGDGSVMRIALYQPDIAQNTGTILRLCACLGTEAHIVEPAGFPTTDRAFRRAGMDYLDQVRLVRHVSWPAFERWREEAKLRLVLLTTRAAQTYLDHRFAADDVLLFGRESAGVPEEVHAAADARLVIPMRPGLRSINVAMACAMALGEALRQTGRLPPVRR
jgi:tRNA (cytidine/uridine-2'-O-)-methyltransferase